ncbi:MAG: Thiol-disulfide oxidoreductase ResA [Myxococcota bacterium]|nr:Thiol-disulfide oxidoreductase ResA [Myxococcota bacterium]
MLTFRRKIVSTFMVSVMSFFLLSAGGDTFHVVGADEYQDIIRGFKGKPALVFLWATWCGWCRREMPHIRTIAAEMKGRVHMLGVSLDDPDSAGDVEEFVRGQKLDFRQVIANPESVGELRDAIDPYWSGGIPALFIYTKSGFRTISLYGYSTAGEIRAGLKKVL